MESWTRHLLWIDSRAGLCAGAFMLALSGWLDDLYGLPRPLLLAMGVANVAYGSFSFALNRRPTRPLALIRLLSGANAAWALLCCAAAARMWSEATWLGVGALLGEGLIVGGLAALEWKNQDALAAGR